jgi:hypothetical protein
MDIQEVMKRVLSGEITRENDEKHAGGFYDLALELADGDMNKAESIYEALWGVHEWQSEKGGE